MPIAVTGASGVVGSRVVDQLIANGAEVIALSRQQRTNSPGLTWRVADYWNLESISTGLQDVDTLVFVSSDGPATEVVTHHHNIVAAARATNVKHVVMLSGLDAEAQSPFCYANSYAYTEHLLRESGCAFSIARASIFTEFFKSFLDIARASGELRLPAANARLSLVAKADVANCLVALALNEPSNKHHHITGPGSLSCEEIATIASETWGTSLKYVDIPSTDFCKELINGGEDIWWTYAYSSMFESIRQGRWELASSDVEQLTDRPPKALKDCLFD